MSDDWMDRLAGTARDRAQHEAETLDPRWRALTRGALSDDEAKALRQEGDTSPRQRLAAEAFAPIDPAVKSHIAAHARSQLRAFQPAASDGPAPIPPSSPAPVPTGRRQRRRRAPWASRVVALAAAFVLSLGAIYLANMDRPVPPETALVPFQLTLDGGRTAVRSAPNVPTTVFGPGSLLTIDLLPQTAFAGPADVALFMARGDTVVRVSLPDEAIMKHRSGAVEIQAEIGRDWSPTPGAATLLIVVGRPGALPSIDALVTHRETGTTVSGSQPGHPPWQRFEREITIVDI